MKDVKVGYALTGSFCTFSKALPCIEQLCNEGADVFPIMSYNAAYTDTRFGESAMFREKIETMCGKSIITTVAQAEPIGPKALLDVLIIAPCTGNTLGKLANGVYDTSVTMAAKAHLRNNRPVIVAVSTNDGLSASAKNIGILLNMKNYYFVPMRQDDPIKKPASLVADFSQVLETARSALENVQIQPILI